MARGLWGLAENLYFPAFNSYSLSTNHMAGLGTQTYKTVIGLLSQSNCFCEGVRQVIGNHRSASEITMTIRAKKKTHLLWE